MLPNLGPMEMMIIGGIAVLMFGKRLPEVGRSLGKGIVEFKKGLRGVEEELGDISGMSSHSYSSNHGYGDHSRYESPSTKETTYSDTAVPKFELPSPPAVAPTEYQPQSPAQS